MKKLLLILVFIASYTQAQQYVGLDTLNRTVSTATYDTLRLGTGEKSIEVWNKTTGTLNIGFRSTLYATLNLRDTNNIIQVPAGNKVLLLNRKDTVIFIKSTVSGIVTSTVFYGKGDPPIVYYPFNSSGQINVSTLSNVDTSFIWAVDTVNGAGDTLHKFSTYTLTNLSTKFPNKWQLTITSDSTIEVSTTASFTAGQTFRVKTGESWTSSYYSGLTAVYIRRHSSIIGVTTWRADIHGY